MTTLFQKTDFSQIPIEKSWSFSDKTIKDTAYITHGYYTYPAKFIPHLAARVIIENSKEGDIIIDPFMEAVQPLLKQSLTKELVSELI